jgi:hypothetical protein
MESNWAAEHLQVIRTLMERSAVYRRALAPVMLTTGSIGALAALIGRSIPVSSHAGFAGYWMVVSVVALLVSLLMVRLQALKEAEPFWSPPMRRVAQAFVPPLFAGMAVGFLAAFFGQWKDVQPWGLPALWMVLYGCALHAGGFFMVRGIKLFGWLFILTGCGLLAGTCSAGGPSALPSGHVVMGGTFGGLHLAYGIYLYFTERGRKSV